MLQITFVTLLYFIWVIQTGQGVQGENTADFIKLFYPTIDRLCFFQFFMRTELYWLGSYWALNRCFITVVPKDVNFFAR